MPRPAHWLEYMLTNYTAAELQAGVSSHRLTRKSPTDPTDRRTAPIVSQRTKIRGTGIPASTMQKFRDDVWTPRKKTIDKLALMYDRINYRELRNAGASVKEAKKKIRSKNVDKYIREYRKLADYIAKKKKVDLDVIIYYMGLSDKTLEKMDRFYPKKR